MRVPHRNPARHRASALSVLLAAAAAGAVVAAPSALAAPEPLTGTVVAVPGAEPVLLTVPPGYCAAAFELVDGLGDDPAARRGVGAAVDVVADQQFWLSPGAAGSPAGAASEVLAADRVTVLLSTQDPDAAFAESAESQGQITSTLVPCEVPRKPVLDAVVPAGPDSLALRLVPPHHVAGSGRDVVTGYQVSLDAGATWAPLATTPEDGGGALLARVDGLPRAVHRVAVRALSGTGPGAASPVVQASLLLQLGTPSGVTATAGTSSIAVAWTPPADAAGVTGYRVVATPAGGGTPAACEVPAAVHGCRLGVPAGAAYDVVVTSVGPAGEYVTVPAAPVTTGVVPAPAVPAAVPPASGALGAPGSAVPGGALQVAGAGFLPHSTVTLVVYSTPTVLGTVVADATGAFTGTVALPAGLAPGTHTLVALGVDPAGDPRSLVSAVGVAGAAPAARAGGGPALADTGAEVTGPAVTGAAALVLGAALTLAGRRRPAAPGRHRGL